MKEISNKYDEIINKLNMMETKSPTREAFEYAVSADIKCREAFEKGESAAVIIQFDDCFMVVSCYVNGTPDDARSRPPSTAFIKGEITRIHEIIGV